MKLPKNASRIILFGVILVFFITASYAQTKKTKRPKSNVGISSVDNFVRDSFNVYDKVYMYDGYATGVPFVISKTRLETDSKGESIPVSDNSTSDGKAQNRRVEFVKI